MSNVGDQAFAKRVLTAREALGITQSELATRSGIPNGTISHFETGARKPSFDNLKKLADALDVSADYLLGRIESFNFPINGDFEKLDHADQRLIEILLERLVQLNNGGSEVS